jgi:NAD-dependent SIR2 family protein deacetylase
METARAMTLQQSIEVATRNWASIHGTDRCPRCSGLMVDEWYQDLSDYRAQRCVQCGEMIDPVILHNRGALYGPMATHLAGKTLLSNCLTKNR